MTSLKDLRDRIASVKATQKITKAMQTVAAVKLRRAQEAIIASRPYSECITTVLANARSEVRNEDMPRLISGSGRNKTQLIITCTSERGLCGSFNARIMRSARNFIQRGLKEEKQIKIITVGKKGADVLKRDFGHLIIDQVNLREGKQVRFAHACTITEKILTLFHAEEFDVCTLFYSHFHSIIRQEPVKKQLIPLTVNNQEASRVNYEYEPDIISMLEDLGIKNLAAQVFHALLENVAGEMGAKMSAMDNATRNAGEMINKLSVTYNRQRQAQITTELIEIIAGAEAL